LKICKIQKKVQKVIQFSSLGFLLILLMGSCEKDMSPFVLHDNSQPTVNPIPAPDVIIPLPVSDVPTGKLFTLTKKTNIYISPDIQALREIGHYLADKLMFATGYEIRILPTTLDILPEGSIWLTTKDGNPSLGEEGYELNVTQKSITLFAFTPCGVFRGIQTLRQIFPSSIEAPTILPGPWQIVTRTIRDYPRFAWRGAMLDVARHFFSVEDVKHYIDLLAYYKINVLHLHLTDDQGWRIMIESWPDLAIYGGSREVGGGPGGYYSQAEYADLVAYAKSRYMMLVPEIDMPGHTNAALASYPELNANNVAPPLYTGTHVGFSSLSVHKDITYTFVSDVIKEVAALTPGPYIHIGGDEAYLLSDSDYNFFIQKADSIVRSYGKRMVGWEEIARANISSSSISQHWHSSNLARTAVQKDLKIVMSPATKAYMDMKYNNSTPLGLTWAGYTNVQDAYTWNPATQIDGVAENMIMGVEAPLWTETIQAIDDIEFMTFPRLPGYAEIGWTPEALRDWDTYKIRLGSHGPKLEVMGINFYYSPLVPWGITDSLAVATAR